MRWILVSTVALVGSVAASLGLMLTATGKVVPDMKAREAAQALDAEASALDKCVEAANKLNEEVGFFRGASKVLEQQPEPVEEPPAPEPPPKGPKGRPLPPPKSPKEKPKPKPKQVDQSAQAWPAATATYVSAGQVEACRTSIEKHAPAEGEAVDGWAAVQTVTKLKVPKPEDPTSTSLTAARQVFAAVEKAPVQAVATHAQTARDRAKAAASAATTAADSATIQQPLPQGVLGREVAIAAGVFVSLAALLISFFSLRATSVRRAASLAPYRKSVHPPERGLHAAMILRLAAETNGGEPGIVLGAGVGGLLAAAIARADVDWYVAGVAAGLVLGLLIQTVVKTVGLTQHFRARALAIAEIEKPAVPIVLVLQTVRPGQEEDFVGFFMKLAPTEAAHAVEKLATQAEEQILIAVDAQKT